MEVGNLRRLKFDSSKCIGCGQCEVTCSQAYFKTDDRTKSAIRINEGPDGYVMTACTQCGKCIDLCPVNALKFSKSGAILLNKNACVGCLSCVGFCDYDAMFYTSDNPVPFKCTACGLCVKACPTGALEIEII